MEWTVVSREIIREDPTELISIVHMCEEIMNGYSRGRSRIISIKGVDVHKDQKAWLLSEVKGTLTLL